MAIFVETFLRRGGRAPCDLLEDVWARSQEPGLHERWDLRFSEIRYLPKPEPGAPQRFLYATRIGFGLTIRGEGESVGERSGATGERASALEFWSDDPKSLIARGSGYWKYIPRGDGVVFLTLYDYRVRFGFLGRAVDRMLFRPLLAWATAWSFDRLRLWVTRDVDPAASRDAALVHAVCRMTLALVWIWQGLVPKLLGPHADELTMLAQAGVPGSAVADAARLLGALEILFGIALLATWRRPALLAVNVALMGAALLAVTLKSPSFLGAAFNPVSLNVAVAALGLAGLLAARHAPFASRCTWSSRR